MDYGLRHSTFTFTCECVNYVGVLIKHTHTHTNKQLDFSLCRAQLSLYICPLYRIYTTACHLSLLLSFSFKVQHKQTKNLRSRKHKK